MTEAFTAVALEAANTSREYFVFHPNTSPQGCTATDRQKQTQQFFKLTQ